MSADGQNVEEQSWLQRSDESDAWYSRFVVYLGMGAGRSVRGVYNKERGNETSKAVPASWSAASKRFEWLRRAKAFEEWRRATVLQAGNAQDAERVNKLNILIDKLFDRIMAYVDLMPVTDKLLATWLQCVDLMAKHTGGYAPQRLEHTGKDGGKIEVEETKVNVVFYIPEVAALDSEDVDSAGQITTGGAE